LRLPYHQWIKLSRSTTEVQNE